MPRVDADEIGAAHQLTAKQVRSLYAARKSNGFPEAKGTRPGAGKRPQSEWDKAEVDAWFARRRKPASAPGRAVQRDPGELLTAAEASRRLGYKNPAQLKTYFDKGSFIDPDEEVESPESGRVRRRWRADRVDAWNENRPGQGRRAGSSARQPSATTAATGAPDDLIGAAEASRILGLGGVSSFDTTLYKGDLPLLAQPASTRLNGRRVRRWRRSVVEEQAEQRRPQPQPPVEGEGDNPLLTAEEAAPLLGYANAKSLRTMIARGALPHLDRPDDPGPPARWKKAVVLAQARAKAGHVG